MSEADHYYSKLQLLAARCEKIAQRNTKAQDRIRHVKKEIKHLKCFKSFLVQRLLRYNDKFHDINLEIPEEEPCSKMDDLFFSDVLARADRILVGIEPFPKFELLQTQASMIKPPPVRQPPPFHHRVGPGQTPSSSAVAGVGLQWHPSTRNPHLQHHMAARSSLHHTTGDLFKIPITLEDAEQAANSLERLAYNGDGEDWDEDDIPPDIMYSPASAQSSSAADPQAQDLPRLTLTPADFDAAIMGAVVASAPSVLPHGTLEVAVQAFGGAPALMKEEISFDSILKDIKSSSEQLGKKIEPP